MVVGIAAAPNEDKAKSSTPASNAKASVAATPTPDTRVHLNVTGQKDGITVHKTTFRVKGSATLGSRIEINHHKVVSRRGKFDQTVSLHAGRNTISVRARKYGLVNANDSVHVTRKLTAGEKAAVNAQRAAAHAAAMASFKAGAQTIAYNQLDKNADRYNGTHVKFTGQILQVQENAGGGMMLLSVTNEGDGFYTDNVWVDYDNPIKSAKDDVITVYGTITGSKSYDTQIGGSTYVPRMHTKYVEE